MYIIFGLTFKQRLLCFDCLLINVNVYSFRVTGQFPCKRTARSAGGTRAGSARTCPTRPTRQSRHGSWASRTSSCPTGVSAINTRSLVFKAGLATLRVPRQTPYPDIQNMDIEAHVNASISGFVRTLKHASMTGILCYEILTLMLRFLNSLLQNPDFYASIFGLLVRISRHPDIET